MPGIKLKIRQTDLMPHSARVWLDDLEITNCLQGVTVTWGVGDVTKAELSIMVDDLDLDTRTLAVLAAHVAEQDERA